LVPRTKSTYSGALLLHKEWNMYLLTTMLSSAYLGMVAVPPVVVPPIVTPTPAPTATSTSTSTANPVANANSTSGASAVASPTINTANTNKQLQGQLQGQVQGQQQGQKQSATASANTTSSNNAQQQVTQNYQDRLQAPAVFAPSVNTTSPCVISGSGGVSLAGGGIVLGGGIHDTDCRNRNLIEIEAKFNPFIAQVLTCDLYPAVARAFEEVGERCTDRPKVLVVTPPPPPPTPTAPPPPPITVNVTVPPPVVAPKPIVRVHARLHHKLVCGPGGLRDKLPAPKHG
jgi:hypothetical protein